MHNTSYCLFVAKGGDPGARHTIQHLPNLRTAETTIHPWEAPVFFFFSYTRSSLFYTSCIPPPPSLCVITERASTSCQKCSRITTLTPDILFISWMARLNVFNSIIISYIDTYRINLPDYMRDLFCLICIAHHSGYSGIIPWCPGGVVCLGTVQRILVKLQRVEWLCKLYYMTWRERERERVGRGEREG